MTKQFGNLIVAHPIMLIIVENRDEHVEMSKQLLQGHIRSKFNLVICTVAPIGKTLVQSETLGCDRIPERFKNLSEELLASPARQCWNRNAQWQSSVHQFRTLFT